MSDEPVVDERRTHLLAVEASLSDARRALLRASRISSAFSAELRALLVTVVEIDRRVLLDLYR